MHQSNARRYPTDNGYLTETIRTRYIAKAVDAGLLPENAHRMAHLVSLEASDDPATPIQFWQLHSVLGHDRIVALVRAFYTRVFDDQAWFSCVFARIGDLQHHVSTQAAMWIDVMGGGRRYHGGEYRLSFHHTHNAMALMNDRGAERWVALMVATLDDPAVDLADDARVRPAINTFLAHFMSKYADEFGFADDRVFGVTNAPVRRRLNLLNMTSDAIESLSEDELTQALLARKVDVARYTSKEQLVNKALSL